MASLTLRTTPDRLAVARLAPDAALPGWAGAGAFTSVTRTPTELSVVCAETEVPDDVVAERGWRALVVDGPIPFDLPGILAAVLVPLGAAEVPIFALSTYDTDWILVPGTALPTAVATLRAAGHTIAEPDPR